MSPTFREIVLGDLLSSMSGTKPLIVAGGLTLQSAVVMAHERQEIDTFAIVDDSQVLIGVLTVDALVEDVLADLFPEGFLPDVTGLDSLMSSAGLFVKHRVVEEIMDEPHSVNHSDLVGSAIQKMRINKLRGLPIVDTGGRVTGYLDLFDVLVAWVTSEPDEMEGV